MSPRNRRDAQRRPRLGRILLKLRLPRAGLIPGLFYRPVAILVKFKEPFVRFPCHVAQNWCSLLDSLAIDNGSFNFSVASLRVFQSVYTAVHLYVHKHFLEIAYILPLLNQQSEIAEVTTSLNPRNTPVSFLLRVLCIPSKIENLTKIFTDTFTLYNRTLWKIDIIYSEALSKSNTVIDQP